MQGVMITMVNGNAHNVFADYVREKMAGRSARQIAARGGFSPTTMTNILQYGTIVKDDDTLEKIAYGLGVPYDELAQKSREARVDPLRDIETALRRRYTDWPDDKRKAVMDRIKDILDHEEQ